MTESKPSFWELSRKYWRNDLIAAVSVSLVALPLALGIAIAAEAPPMAGIISAIIGGIVTTFVRSSHVAINGPANSLIVVVLIGNHMLADENGSGFPYVLAATCVAGIIQVALGLLKLGRIGELIPHSVVKGLLAAIGLIILVKQLHVGLGHHSLADTGMGTILELPESILALHPLPTIITIAGLFILISYPKVKNKLFHFFPAPVWVLAFIIPVVFIYRSYLVDFFGVTSELLQFPEKAMINLPENIWSAIVFPDFGKFWTGNFWLVVISIVIVTTIETLISTKAVDSLDPMERKTDLNKDLAAIGGSSTLSGFLGGLPIITVIVRSSVNVQNNAKTRLSNFFHGVILLLFILLLKPVLEEVPLAALAAILIFTGYKLTSPREFAEAYEKGEEQLLVMAFTFLSVMVYGLLTGIFLGLCMAFLVQWIKSRMSMQSFVSAVFRPRMEIEVVGKNYELRLSGVFNFLNYLRVKAEINKVPIRHNVLINCQDAVLIDYNIMSYLQNVGKQYRAKGGEWKISGFENHESTSNHPLSMKMLLPQHQHSPRWMNDHQRDMMRLASLEGWQFVIGKEYMNDGFKAFPFFKAHPVEYTHNTITGLTDENNLYFTLMDVVFAEGAFLGKISYDTTLMVVDLPEKICEFVLEKEELYDRIFQKITFEDINFKEDPEFSKHVLLRGPDVDATRDLFDEKLRHFVLRNPLYHIECSGKRLLVFGKRRLLNYKELEDLVSFVTDFISHLPVESFRRPVAPEEN